MTKKVIYTCCVGGYDAILQPEAICEDYDYVCFSNDIKEQRIGVWQIRPIPYAAVDKTFLSRYPKLQPHLLLGDYDYSVYIDSNVQIIEQEFYRIIDEKISSGCLIAQVRHCEPPIDCIYDDIPYAFRYNKITFCQAWHQTKYLHRHHFPRHYGLFENNLIFRSHLDERVIRISDQWWEEYSKTVPRDQFSLMYVYWKEQYMPELLLPANECTRNTHLLRYHLHLSEQRVEIPLKDVVSNRLHEVMYPYVKKMLQVVFK